MTLFKVLAVKANSMTVKSKECVLCVEEMSLKSFIFFDFKKDKLIGLTIQNSLSLSMLLNQLWSL